MKDLFEKLKDNFKLDEKHILILDLLQYEDLDAHEISKKTKIPHGRIYDYLNFLIEKKLIDRNHKKPFIYSSKDLNEKVIVFMKKEVDKVISAQSDVMDLMSGANLSLYERITNSKKFTQVHLSMIAQAKDHINYVSLHTSLPYVMYPFEREMFMKLRRAVVDNRPTITYFDPLVALLVYKTYKEAFVKGKSMTAIFEKSSFDNHIKIIKKLGKKFFLDWKKIVLSQFDKYKIQAFIIDEYLPMQIDINERSVNLSLRHHSIINGIVINGQGITELYDKVFEQHLKRAKSVVPLIKNLKY